MKKVFSLTRALILAPFLIGVSSAYGQVDAGALQQNLERQLPIPSPLALPEPTAPSPSKTLPKKDGQILLKVSKFTLEGVHSIPESEVQAVLQPWLGKEVSLNDLQDACDAIENLYRKYHFIVVATVPPQKISDGVVKIRISEVKLSAVIVDTPQGETRFSKDLAAEYITYANPIDDLVNSQSIDRALVILNETPGVMVSGSLEPGGKDGETQLRVQLTQPPLVYGRVEANNYGSRLTGANQGIGSVSLSNPTGIGDQFSATGIDSAGSQYLQANYSLPGSKDGLRLGASGTYLAYKNVSSYANATGASTGNAWTSGLSAAYPLLRSGATNLNSSINYDLKSYTNNLLVGGTTLSSYNIKNLSFGLSGNHYDQFYGGGTSAGSVNLVFGSLDILSTSQVGYGRYTPSSFTKITASGNRNQQLSEDGNTSLYMAISGQLSSVDLNSAEQFYLGGPYAVRAYPVSQGGGSQGGLGTIELRQAIQE